MVNLTVIGGTKPPVVEEEPEINEDAIRLVEELLADLKTGEIRDVALAWTCDDGSISNSYTVTYGMCTQIASVARLAFRMQKGLDE